MYTMLMFEEKRQMRDDKPRMACEVESTYLIQPLLVNVEEGAGTTLARSLDDPQR